MSKTSIIVLITTILIAAKIYPYFKLKNLTQLKWNKLQPVSFPTPVSFDSVENLKPNNLLTQAQYIGKGELQGPETIVFSRNGSMYTGLLNGQIVRIEHKDSVVHRVTQIGAQTIEKICNDYGPELRSKLECGRPLGLRIKKHTDMLYIADSYLGIYKLDLSNGDKTAVISSVDVQFKDVLPKLVNDLDINEDGLIYFIDSSYEHEVNEAIEEHIEALPKGRLFSFDEQTNKLELLKEGLYFPNGLQLMPDQESVLINENSMARILRFYVKGGKKGKTEIFLDNMPGFSDTIRLTDKNTLFVPFVVARHSKTASVLDVLGEYPNIRALITWVLNLRQLIFVMPKYGLLAEYDLNGRLLKTWHDPTGKVVEEITAATLHNGKIYVGSFYIDYIAVVDYEQD